MPNVIFPIPDIEETVDRQIAVNVASQVIESLKLNKNKLRIRIPGYLDVIPLPGANSNDSDIRNDLYQHDNVTVSYSEEEPEENLHTTTSTYRPNEPYLFHDSKLNITLSPIHVYTKAKLNFTYTGVDRNSLEQFNANMRRMYYQIHQAFVVEPSYKYFISNACLATLSKLYGYAKLFDPSEEIDSEVTWLYKHFVRSINTAPSADGKPQILIKNETQSGIYASIDPETKVTPESTDGKYSITYTIEFDYYKPSVLRLEYPIMIRQQLIARKFRPINTAYDPNFKTHYTEPNHLATFRQFLRFQGLFKQDDREYRCFPSFDEWRLRPLKNFQVPIFTYLGKISKEDKRSLFSIYNIEDVFTFSQPIFDYMEAMGEKMLSPVASAIQIVMFYNNNRMDNRLFNYVDGVIESKTDLDPNYIYRTVLCISTNWLNPEFDLNTFIQHGKAVLTILYTLHPQILYDNPNIVLNDDGSIDKTVFIDLVEKYQLVNRNYNLLGARISITCKPKEGV